MRMKINYSTAKTIMFLYRKNCPPPSFFNYLSPSNSLQEIKPSTFALAIESSRALKKIEVISTVGGNLNFSKLLDEKKSS